ncbi:alpha/beta fold hydrolase [Bacillus thermotolerans]|uniref:alpha/beta fold hydrolase n=1 Tax=Bacillus thermotolerans TaxID=1221996 RepID=UPI00057D44C6|nr:alpha/beta hydrolase [Bacillus thermotolerans]KKB33644.1 carboxylesterase NA [Bacillus thermotolerans]
MKKRSIYEHSSIKQHLLHHYENYLPLLEAEVEREYVKTRFGTTHVLQLGKKGGQPLFIFHGANCINPMTLSWFKPLFNEYRIYAPDLIGHPGYSVEGRLGTKDGSFASWANDLLDHYHIQKTAFAGVSYGGGIALKTAAAYPEKAVCTMLVVPAGIVPFSKWWTARTMMMPYLLYQLNDAAKQRQAITDALSSGCMRDIDEDIMSTILQHVSIEYHLPDGITRRKLKHYQAPTLVIAGDDDVFFPSHLLFKKAVQLLGDCLEWHAYRMGHFPSEYFLEEINRSMASFLKKHY